MYVIFPVRSSRDALPSSTVAFNHEYVLTIDNTKNPGQLQLFDARHGSPNIDSVALTIEEG